MGTCLQSMKLFVRFAKVVNIPEEHVIYTRDVIPY